MTAGSSTGYRLGRADVNMAARTGRLDVLDAVRAWKDAQNDHATTSYYGYRHVRAMRGYWLGILRTQREQGWGWHTFHLPGDDGSDLAPRPAIGLT